MSFDFLNPGLLIGALGIALPVLAHLISRRKYDVVDWGAMQFLELGREARRRIRLEQWLLMLVRIGLILLIVFALARPWASGGIFRNLAPTQSRDVVLVIDGSYSMGWEGSGATPHAAAITWARTFLEDLRPGDTVSLIDVRDRPRYVIEVPTQDLGYVRRQLDLLPPPSGTSNLGEAVAAGITLLSRTNNLSREVIVISDGQARAWRAEEKSTWRRIDDLLEQASIRPRIWGVDVGTGKGETKTNFSVDRLQLSRELTVAEYPIRVRTTIRAHGLREATTRKVHLEIDGQRLAEKMLQVRLAPDGEASVDFEHQFSGTGSHVISVVLDADALTGDDRADAAIVVANPPRVLIVDGDPHVDSSRSESRFAQLALSPPGNPAPWVKATTIPVDQMTGKSFENQQVALLLNVPRLNASQHKQLREFLDGGGGLFVALGNRVDAAEYNGKWWEKGKGFLPVELISVEKDPGTLPQGIRPVEASLEAAWLRRFHAEQGGGFTEARFVQWWKVRGHASVEASRGNPPPAGQLPVAVLAGVAGETSGNGAKPGESPHEVGATLVRLETSDPLLISGSGARGNVMLWTSSLDADWNTLPTRHDFVPFLHEAVFQLVSRKFSRNVDVGQPLLMRVDEIQGRRRGQEAGALPATPAAGGESEPEFDIRRHAFFAPGDVKLPATPTAFGSKNGLRLDDTRLPGLYQFRGVDEKGEAVADTPSEFFVVNFDRSESNLTGLDETGRETLAKPDRLTFIRTPRELREQVFSDDSRVELWELLIVVFISFLVLEVFMIRRLVRGGQVFDESELGSDRQGEKRAAESLVSGADKPVEPLDKRAADQAAEGLVEPHELVPMPRS